MATLRTFPALTALFLLMFLLSSAALFAADLPLEDSTPPAPPPFLGSAPSPSISRQPSRSPSSAPSPAAPGPEVDSPFHSPPAPPGPEMAPGGPYPAPSSSSSPSPSPSSSQVPQEPSPTPAPTVSAEIRNSDAGSEGSETPTSSSGGGMSGGKKAGIALGVLLAAGAVVLGAVVYKKRQENIRRSRYGYAARQGLI